MRPINVGFSNRFFCLSDKWFPLLNIKKNLKKINLRVCFLPLKIVFFGGFENDNISSSKSYTVTKSRISPQRKLGSFFNFNEDQCIDAHPRGENTRTRDETCARLVVNYYLIN